ncbi:TetR/AcrR family transcriptional regulator [Aeromicrobium sp. A1-2]|uniref:TetR/AcrR family transcriptional regulator n=1 Tax=Aeromicrobium sp. A1-2 TaxID=2107713 RepID=UPI000E5498D7|nr:TetR/AcrR family transcriptional regulator [Aeromicrobium sp. A1-2]AXT86011.1 TetR/AcrR family transcriptional regulator [Aeromicrobium sp. A1-2]
MDRKPGRPRLLSLDAIVEAVLADGISTFSMPSVAARLGVAHSGLYRYVHDGDDLLVSAIERAALSAHWPEADLPWRDLLREISHTVQNVCERYPGYAVAALSPPRWSTKMVDQIGPYIISLQRQGFTIEDASVAVTLAGNLALTTSLAGVTAAQRSTDIPRESSLAQQARVLDIVLDGLAGRLIA